MWNPVLRGWIQCYGRFYKSALYPVFRYFDDLLVRWAMRKYKRLRRHHRQAAHWLAGVATREPRLFAHWYLLGPSAGRPDDGSRMSGDVQVRFCERPGVKFPRATHLVILVDAYRRHDWLLDGRPATPPGGIGKTPRRGQ